MKLTKRNILIATCAAGVLVTAPGAVPSPAAAASSSQNFNVTVNLSSVCAITAAPTDVAFTYTSFQAAASTATGGAFSVRCTNLLPYTLALDATSGTVIGLNYSLALSAPSGTGNGAAGRQSEWLHGWVSLVAVVKMNESRLRRGHAPAAPSRWRASAR
mgnify:CR=1 FL=1